VLWSPCCSSYFDRNCVQSLAISAGSHHFRWVPCAQVCRQSVLLIRIQLFTLYNKDSDPDPDFYFCIMRIRIRIQLFTLNNEDLGPDPAFHLNAARSSSSDEKLLSMAQFRASRLPRLYFESLKLLNFDFNADPDPSCYSDADPDQASKNNAAPDPQHPAFWSGSFVRLGGPRSGKV
jgi:hypothetical protein